MNPPAFSAEFHETILDSPVQVAELKDALTVANGDEHTCALTKDKALFCWGSNVNGQLGISGLPSAPTPTQVTSLTSIAELAVGDEHTCIRKSDTTIWCWGYNGSGAVGNGNDTNVPTPVKVFTGAQVFLNGIAFHSCAIGSEDTPTIFCWGANDEGQTGTGSEDVSILSPTRVPLVAVTDITLGGSHSCAVTQDGAVWCWGHNESGQIGRLSGEHHHEPEQVNICQ